jgi:hypothetical protein
MWRTRMYAQDTTRWSHGKKSASVGSAVAQAVSRRLLIAEARVWA